jgi:hypothetical protein
VSSTNGFVTAFRTSASRSHSETCSSCCSATFTTRSCRIPLRSSTPRRTTSTETTSAPFNQHPQAKRAISDLGAIKTSLSLYISVSVGEELATASSIYKGQLKEVDAGLARLQSVKRSIAGDVKKARAELAKGINILESNPSPKDSGFILNVNKAIDATIKEIKNSKARVTTSSTVTTTGVTQRLRAQIIRPDCFFSPPPRCNVIFPEQYTQLSYDRMFLAEVTRSLVLAYNTLVGKDALLADRILAPSVGVDTELLAVKPGKEGYRALMKHELHTGIIPRSEWLPNTASFSSAKTDPNKDSVKTERAGWARKIALFHFFKYRFGPRTASVGGRFNPYLVCGFPALIITRPFIIPGISQSESPTDSDLIEQILGNTQTATNGTSILGTAPSQLVGMVGGLSHSLDQNGGSTSVSMNHVRQHLGVDDEFLGVLLATKGTTKKRIRVRLTADAVARSSKQALKEILLKVTPQTAPTPTSGATNRGLSNKTSTNVRKKVDPATQKKIDEEFLATFQVTNENNLTSVPAAPPPLTKLGRIDKIERDLLVPNPSGKLSKNGKGVFGTIIGVEVIDASVVQLSNVVNFTAADTEETFVPVLPKDLTQKTPASISAKNTKKAKVIKGQAYKEVILYEEVDVPAQVVTPVEEVIRPKWFSESYSNANIGKKIYQPFFGVPSIIDEAGFDGLGTATASSEPPASSSEGETRQAEEDLDTLVADLAQKEDALAKLSIERSVNFISYIYGLVKAKDLDVDDFIRQYANRPIATLPQILGDPDLDLDVAADGTATAKQVTGADGSIRTPRIGFHSLAVHPKVVDQGNLAGLLVEPDLQVQRINNTGKSEPIPPEYDIRKAKKDRVRQYIAALGLGPAFRG